MHNICTNSITGFVAQSFKKNQESLYYIDFRFLVGLVIIVFNKKKILITEKGSFTH